MSDRTRTSADSAEEAVVAVLRAFSSYAWKSAEDMETVGRLVAELRLRGFTVFRDRDSLPPGASMETWIRDELRRSDLVMPLLTPSSVQSDPVVELELKAARDLHRDMGRPVLVPIVRNLGSTHAEVTAATFDRLGHDFASKWVTLASDGDDPLGLPDVAQIAASGLRAVLRPGEGPDDGTWSLAVATRGDRPVAKQLLIDATDLLGGQCGRGGDPETWRRVLVATCDRQTTQTDPRSQRNQASRRGDQ
jgi:TIR domain